MQVLRIVALSLAVWAMVTAADAPDAKLEGVLDLTPSNFDDHVGKEAGVLVEFYAPWCGHCKNLVPEYAKLGAAVTASGTDKVVIAKVDANAHSDLGSRFSVSGFPTIKWFPAGSTTPEDYNGGRDAKAFVDFINGKTGLSLHIPKEVTHVTELDALNFDSVALDSDKDVLVEFYAPWCGHCKTLAPKYNELAKTFAAEKNVVIANVDADNELNKALAKKYEVQGFPTLKFFPRGSDKTPVAYEGGREIEDLLKYVNEKAGTHRVVGGGLAESAGTDPDLNGLVQQLVQATTEAARSDAVKKIAERVSELGEASQFYSKAAAKYVEQGAKWVEKEVARLTKMLEGKASLAQRDSMFTRLNVLRAFKAE